jgi:hypothetical protein
MLVLGNSSDASSTGNILIFTRVADVFSLNRTIYKFGGATGQHFGTNVCVSSDGRMIVSVSLDSSDTIGINLIYRSLPPQHTTITEGNYTAGELAAEIQRQMNKVGSGSTTHRDMLQIYGGGIPPFLDKDLRFTIKYDVSFDPITGKFVFTTYAGSYVNVDIFDNHTQAPEAAFNYGATYTATFPTRIVTTENTNVNIPHILIANDIHREAYDNEYQPGRLWKLINYTEQLGDGSVNQTDKIFYTNYYVRSDGLLEPSYSDMLFDRLPTTQTLDYYNSGYPKTLGSDQGPTRTGDIYRYGFIPSLLTLCRSKFLFGSYGSNCAEVLGFSAADTQWAWRTTNATVKKSVQCDYVLLSFLHKSDDGVWRIRAQPQLIFLYPSVDDDGVAQTGFSVGERIYTEAENPIPLVQVRVQFYDINYATPEWSISPIWHRYQFQIPPTPSYPYESKNHYITVLPINKMTDGLQLQEKTDMAFSEVLTSPSRIEINATHNFYFIIRTRALPSDPYVDTIVTISGADVSGSFTAIGVAVLLSNFFEYSVAGAITMDASGNYLSFQTNGDTFIKFYSSDTATYQAGMTLLGLGAEFANDAFYSGLFLGGSEATFSSGRVSLTRTDWFPQVATSVWAAPADVFIVVDISFTIEYIYNGEVKSAVVVLTDGEYTSSLLSTDFVNSVTAVIDILELEMDVINWDPLTGLMTILSFNSPFRILVEDNPTAGALFGLYYNQEFSTSTVSQYPAGYIKNMFEYMNYYFKFFNYAAAEGDRYRVNNIRSIDGAYGDTATATNTDFAVMQSRLEAGQYFITECPNVTEFAYDTRVQSTMSYASGSLPPFLPIRLLDRPVFFTEEVKSPVSLTTPTHMFMCSKACALRPQRTTATMDNVFAKIQTPSGTKNYNTNVPNDANISDSIVKELSEIDVVFRDKTGAIIDFNNAEHSFDLEITEYEEAPALANLSETRGTRDTTLS